MVELHSRYTVYLPLQSFVEGLGLFPSAFIAEILGGAHQVFDIWSERVSTLFWALLVEVVN